MKKLFLIALALFLVLPFINAEPQKVDVSAYVLNIGKFDVSSGAYTIDFYLDIICPEDCSGIDFEFSNGRATSIDKIIDEPNEKFYRIQANLAENIDLQNYPFDEHELTIVLEDKLATIEELEFVANQESSGIDPNVTIVGWELTGFNARTETHEYKVYDETFSQYIFGVHIKRITISAIMKTFLPLLFIIIAGLLALIIHEQDKLWTRIGINTSALISSVMFHLNVTGSIPPVGYLTFADKFMLITYIVLLLSLFSTVMMMRHAKQKDEKRYNQIYKICLYAIPAITVIGYAALFLIR